MPKVIRARYENGVLKPLEPLELNIPEGKILLVRILSKKILEKTPREAEGEPNISLALLRT